MEDCGETDRAPEQAQNSPVQVHNSAASYRTKLFVMARRQILAIFLYSHDCCFMV